MRVMVKFWVRASVQIVDLVVTVENDLAEVV